MINNSTGAEVYYDSEVFGDRDPECPLEFGQLGWNDEDTWFDVGDKTNDGSTLVRVQLYRGRDKSQPLKSGVAQGHKILAHMPSGSFRIPAKGTMCVVGWPDGRYEQPTGAVIMSVLDKISSNTVFGNVKEGDAVFHGGAPNGEDVPRVVIKSKTKSIVMMTSAANGQTVYLKVAPDSLKFVAPWGTMTFDGAGFRVTTQWGSQFKVGGFGGLPAPFDSAGSFVTAKAANIQLNGVCSLGQAGPLNQFESGIYLPYAAGYVPTGTGTPVPLLPPMSPIVFLTPTVKFATGL